MDARHLSSTNDPSDESDACGAEPDDGICAGIVTQKEAKNRKKKRSSPVSTGANYLGGGKLKRMSRGGKLARPADINSRNARCVSQSLSRPIAAIILSIMKVSLTTAIILGCLWLMVRISYAVASNSNYLYDEAPPIHDTNVYDFHDLKKPFVIAMLDLVTGETAVEERNAAGKSNRHLHSQQARKAQAHYSLEDDIGRRRLVDQELSTSTTHAQRSQSRSTASARRHLRR